MILKILCGAEVYNIGMKHTFTKVKGAVREYGSHYPISVQYYNWVCSCGVSFQARDKLDDKFLDEIVKIKHVLKEEGLLADA